MNFHAAAISGISTVFLIEPQAEAAKTRHSTVVESLGKGLAVHHRRFILDLIVRNVRH